MLIYISISKWLVLLAMVITVSSCDTSIAISPPNKKGRKVHPPPIANPITYEEGKNNASYVIDSLFLRCEAEDEPDRNLAYTIKGQYLYEIDDFTPDLIQYIDDPTPTASRNSIVFGQFTIRATSTRKYDIINKKMEYAKEGTSDLDWKFQLDILKPKKGGWSYTCDFCNTYQKVPNCDFVADLQDEIEKRQNRK